MESRLSTPVPVRGFPATEVGLPHARVQAPLPQSSSGAHHSATFDGPLTVSDPDAIDLLRTVLDQAAFSEDGVRKALGDQSRRLELKRIDFPLYERRLAAPNAINTFIKLFMMQLWVDAAPAEKAIAPLTIERLVSLGLLERGQLGVHSTCALALCDGFIIAHDRISQEREDPQADHVLGVNASAATLANLTVRQRATRTLDIGTGSGIQALLASRHSTHVVGTDTNPRALNYLAFNMRLNRVTNIECRMGSLFEPVAGCKFDLITCNPPYVISPESQLIFRDSGLPGDLICEQVVRQAPEYLEPGGFACILCNWVHKQKQEWSEPVRQWVENSGCDAWVLRGATEDPLSYAAAWTRSQAASNYAEALDRWRHYYATSGIEALSMGAVILRRRTDRSAGWFRADDWPAKPAESCSDQILRVFQFEDYIRRIQDTTLLEHTFSLINDHSLSQQLKFRDGNLICEARRLEIERGLRFQCNLDSHSVVLLSHCDGKQTLAEAIAALSRSADVPVEQISSRAVAVVRQLLAYGFLVPNSTGQTTMPTRRAAGSGVGVQAGQGAATI